MSEQFREAVEAVVPRLRSALLALPPALCGAVTEVRLRAGAPVMLTVSGDSLFLFPRGRTGSLFAPEALTASAEEVEQTFLALCGYSVHSFENEIRAGFLPVAGGHRAGLCGRAILRPDGTLQGVSPVTSINLRIARQIPDAAKPLCDKLFSAGLCSVIVAGPPLSGKTTILRDLARRLSEGLCGVCYRTCVLDSRQEFGTLPFCDVLAGYGKAEGIECAVRALAPQMLICDEVADAAQVRALETGFAAGVHCAVSVHAADETSLLRRQAARALLESGQFDYAVLLDGKKPGVIRRIITVREMDLCGQRPRS